MQQSADVIIIGAGIIGACTAFELTKRGHKTLSLDKLPQAGYGSTSASCAIIRTYYSAVETCALAYEGWHVWRDWPGYIGDSVAAGDLARYHDVGCLVAKTVHNGYLEKACSTMDAIGCPYEHVDAGEMGNYIPGIDTRLYAPAKRLGQTGFGETTGGELSGAVLFPCGGYVSDPMLSAVNVQQAAKALGARFLFNVEVSSVNSDHDQVTGVTLADGATIDAPVVINVGGPHSSIINAMAGVRDSMQMSTRALRHEVAHVPAPDAYWKSGPMVTSDSDIHTYTRPEQGGNLLIGSEDPECDDREWIDDPDNYNTDFTDQCKTLAMRLGQRMPELGIPEKASGVVALYDVTEDWIPIYDKSDLRGFFMACGTSGNQYKNAPVAGKIMTALVEAEAAGHDHDKQPVQFELDNIRHKLSLDFFSRNREINQDSSFSVIG